MRIIALLLMITIFTSSCASMFHGTTENIHVRSEKQNTMFYANEREIGKGTSAVTTIPKNKLNTTTLRASKENCNEKTTPIETSFDALSLLGCLIDFCIVSVLLIDWAATGATTKASQTDYILSPDCPANIN